MKYLSDVALREDDYLLGQIFYSLNEDCQWHRQWSESLVRMAIEDHARNKATIQAWINQWYPFAGRVVHAFASVFETLEPMKTQQPVDLERALDRYYREYLRSMNLEVGPSNL
jgi:1,2-phenylacetyl-CoA epoxidase catalytic subunit